MTTKNKDILCTSIIIIVAIIMFFESFNIQAAVKMNANLGPGFFPLLVAVCMIVLCLIKFYQIITNKDEKYVKKINPNEKTKLSENKVLFVFLAIMIYAAVFESLGFLVSSIIFLFSLFWLLTEKTKRNYISFAVISAVTSGIIYCLFVYGFQLMLPAGILG